MVRLLKVWLNSVTTTSKGLNELYCKQVSLQVRCMVEVREEYWKTKYKPVGILLTCSLFEILQMHLKGRGQLHAYSELLLLSSFYRLEFI